MSGAPVRMPRAEALAVAQRFVARIAGTYDQVVIAGSIRRRLPTVGDIEIVAVPRVEAAERLDMFGELTDTGEVDLLDAHLTMLLDRYVVQQRPDAAGRLFWGLKGKRLTFEGAPFDLFTPCAERFGLILAIRTGPAAFSNALVTPRGARTHSGREGLLPKIYRVQDGWLRYRTSNEIIATPTEQSFFELLGLRAREPWERT